MTTHFWAVPKIGTPAIQIDIDPEALGRNYPLRRRRQRRRQGDAGAHAGARRPRQRRQAQGLDRGGAGDLQGVVRQVQSDAEFGRGADPARSACARSSAGTCPTTPSSSSTPAMPACGWAACTTCARRRRAICAAPAISAGHSRRGSAPSAARRSGRWSRSPAMPASGTTSPRSRPRRAGRSTP